MGAARARRVVLAPTPQPVMRYRISVFGEPRTPWRDEHEAAMQDAIDADLASWDGSRGEHYLAVPVDLQVGRFPA